MKKTLFFDVDGTLYDETHAKIRAEITVAEHIADATGIAYPTVWAAYLSSKNAVMWSSAYDPATNDRARWYAAMMEQLPLPGLTPKALAQLYWDTVCAHIEPYYDLIKALPLLRARYDLCVITDEMRDIQLRKLECLGFGGLFRSLTAADEVGVMKPHPDIFAFALERAGVRAENGLMVGDNPRKDIQGAKAAGMKTALLKRGKFFFYEGPPEEQADILITHFTDFPYQLEEIGF